ncbi:hypothetical protein BH10PSE14_BH10PSE14_23830 [soil metagenome]
MERSITVGDIFAETSRLFSENAALALAIIAGLTILNVVIDQLPASGAAMLGVIASIGLQYWLIRQTLGRREMLDGRAGFPSFFGVNLLSGLAILLGFLALIVPGVFLLARWSAADGALLSEGEGISAALGRSWHITAPHVWPIAGALLIVYGPAFGIGIGVPIMMGDTIPIMISGMTNLLIFTGSVFSWLMGLAIYALLRPGTDALADVFA